MALTKSGQGSMFWAGCNAGQEHLCTELAKLFVAKMNPKCDSGRWGLLTKTRGEHGFAECGGFACDALIWGATNQVVDFVGGSGAPNATLQWNVRPASETRPNNKWFCKVTETEPEEPEKPDPKDDEVTVLLLKILMTLEEIKMGQDNQTKALNDAIVELRKQVEKGVKIRF